MSDNLRSRLKELETTVDALTDEIVDIQQRLDEIEEREAERNEIGVGVDEEEETEDDDIYVA
jgi:predicted  nucleic acid-binding Zn-ribbon protein